jgi:hypothetical protein
MYYSAGNYPGAAFAGKKSPAADEVSDLRSALGGLKSEAVVRSERNKELLSRRMTEIRTEIKSLRSNPYARRGQASGVAPTQIDIRG